MKLAIFVEGTFLPSREGATRRFVGLLRELPAAGVEGVAIHCYRGWSDLGALSAQPFVTYAMDPDTYYFDPARLARLVEEESIDVVQFAEVETLAQIGLPLKRACPWLYLVHEAHDVHSECLRTFGAALSDVEETRKVEETVLPSCDLVTSFTGEDADLLRARGVAADRLKVVPFGVQRPRGIATRSPSESPVVAFVGNLYHQPNARAARAIVETIAPRTRAIRPDIRFEIIGDYSPGDWSGISADDGVEFRGMVPDLQSSLESATIAIAPLTIGTGVRVKMLDYFAARLPVVGTDLAFRGLMMGDAGIVENDLARYPEQVAALCANEGLRAELGARAAQVAERIAWPNISRGLAETYRSLLSGAPLPPSDARIPYRRPYCLVDHQSGGRFSPLRHEAFTGRTVRRLGTRPLRDEDAHRDHELG